MRSGKCSHNCCSGEHPCLVCLAPLRCRQAKLSATSKVIEDIDHSQGLHDYYSTARPSEPGEKAVHDHRNIISRILEMFSKKP